MKSFYLFFLITLLSCSVSDDHRAIVKDFVSAVVSGSSARYYSYTTESCKKFIFQGVYKCDFISSGFDCIILKDSLSADKMNAWVWYANRKAIDSGCYVMSLIKIQDRWYIDNPRVDISTHLRPISSSELNYY